MSFIPYGKQSISDSDIASVISVLKSNYLTTGPKIKDFEQVICDFTKAKYSVAVSNGTAALHLASLALLNENDKVLTTPNSFLATANSILCAKAKPLFVDINPDGNIDLDLCEAYLKNDPEIKAIYVVHFSGNPVNQDKLKYLKETYKIIIVEDCCHAIGAYYIDSDNKKIFSGSSQNSDCSILSFHPVKHLTTGEGGAITTNDINLYNKLLELRNHGMTRNSNSFINNEFAFDKSGETNIWYYEMQSLGFNYRLTDIQCALGISQFDRLEYFIEQRRKLAKLYNQLLKGIPNIRPLYDFTDLSSYHLFTIMIDFEKINISRNQFMIKLKEKGIGTQVHYIPINKQPYYQNLGYGKEKNIIMDNYYNKCLSIPLYPDLQEKDIKYIVNRIKEIL